MERLKELVDGISFEDDFDHGHLEGYLQAHVAAEYKVPYEDDEERGTPVVTDREGMEETVQHLTDLGYLAEEDFNRFSQGHIVPDGIREALQRYYQDDILLTTQYTVNTDFGSPEFLEFLPVLNERLSLLTALDGEFVHKIKLRLSDQNLYSRILHYRLRLLGLFDQDASLPVSSDTLIGAYKLLLLLGEINREQYLQHVRGKQISSNIFNLAGNVYAVLDTFRNQYDSNLLFYTFPCPDVPEAELPYVFVHKGKLISAKNMEAFKTAMRKQDAPMFNWRLRRQDEPSVYNDENLFGVRLVQTVLWINGFYHGRIDGVVGQVTHNALLNFVTSENKTRSDFLVCLKDMTWAVNFAGLSAEMMAYRTTASTEDEEEYLSDNVEPAVMTSGTAEAQKVVIERARDFFEGIKRFARRVYYGARSLIRSAIRGITNVWHFIRDEIVGPVANFFRHLLKQIRTGIRVFFDGMKRFIYFLLKKPLITMQTPGFVVSKFDFDSDGMLFTNGGDATALLTTHLNLQARLTRQVSMFMKVTGEVLAMIISLRPPFGWIRLALKIGKIIIGVVRERFKKDDV